MSTSLKENKIEYTLAKERFVGISDKVSTSMMNLLGTKGRLDSLLTLEIGNTPYTKLALSKEGRRAQNATDFILEGRGQSLCAISFT